jgi:hypothetical protein
MPDRSLEAPPAHLAVVPPPDEPELPIPSPTSPPPPAIVVVPVEKTAAAPTAQPPPADPLAVIMALSEDERLALFS